MTRIQDYQDLVLDALEVVEFKLIRSKADLEDNNQGFHPAMAHQIFGPMESIFGYQGLRVRILYTAGPMQIFLGTEYSASINELSNGEIKADDIVGTISKKLPDGCYFVNMHEYLKMVDKAEKFRPFGEKLSEFCIGSDGNKRVFELYQCDYNVPAFLKFFERLQSFILWFIDAASYIDVDDPQWTVFVCYEKYKNESGDFQYASCGYSTVYEYYAYPENIRPRISQMLVLPPFQRQGLGSKLLQTIYNYYRVQKKVVDITVEDPSEEFQRMRNLVDSKMCRDLESFSKAALLAGFSKEMIVEAREKYKINPRQCRKIYEILRLYHINRNDEKQCTSYRLDVKKRLNVVYHKQMSDIKKMDQNKTETTFIRLRLPTLEDRIEQLQREYEQVEADYMQIIEKLRD